MKVIMKCVNIKFWDTWLFFNYILNAPRITVLIPLIQMLSKCINLIILFLYDDTLQELGILHTSLTLLCFNNDRIQGEDLVPVKCIEAHQCPFSGGGSLVVDSILIVTLIVGFCNCFMFCCALLYIDSSFALILMRRERELVALLCLPGVS